MHGYDGMVFGWRGVTETQFYMKNTPMPLSVAWFGADGRFLASVDMKPCLRSATCPTYSPRVAYEYALEVPQGRLGAVGVGPGSMLKVGGPCAI
jgi:uncharacterized membrane protein (UPF0127 family)